MPASAMQARPQDRTLWVRLPLRKYRSIAALSPYVTTPATPTYDETRPRDPQPAGQAIVWVLWATYGAFYFCRTNISAAVPGMKASPAEGGLGLSAEEVGWILASLKIAYGVGQLFNGQLS